MAGDKARTVTAWAAILGAVAAFARRSGVRFVQVTVDVNPNRKGVTIMAKSVSLPSLPTSVAATGGIGGVVGLVLGALQSGNWSTVEQWIVGIVSTGLVWIASHHGSSIVAAKAKATNASQIPRPPAV